MKFGNIKNDYSPNGPRAENPQVRGQDLMKFSKR
jgi:hypothetical protein